MIKELEEFINNSKDKAKTPLNMFTVSMFENMASKLTEENQRKLYVEIMLRKEEE